MNVDKPHDIIPEREIDEAKRHRYMPLSDAEASDLSGKSVGERAAWVERFRSMTLAERAAIGKKFINRVTKEN